MPYWSAVSVMQSAALLVALCASSAISLCLGSVHAAPVAVTDDSGHAVTLSTPARRIVSLAPHVTELLFASGAASSVVAVAEYSDFPAAARALPRIGGGRGFDLERIAALRPDLVIAWQSGNSAQQVAAIERLAIPIYRSEPRTFEDIARTLERLGQLTGQDTVAMQAAAALRERTRMLRSRYGTRAPVRVFYQVWNRPLMTVGGHHLISQAIQLCGGVNVFGHLSPLAPIVDPEAAVAADPQVIVFTAPLGDATTNRDEPEDVAFWKNWPKVSAVRTGRFVRIDPALIARATPRMLDGTEQLCQAIDAAR